MVTKEELLNTLGHFTYMWGNTFFIETRLGNFEWRDPEYPSGDNTIRPFQGGYKEFRRVHGVPFGRDKGKHYIKDYCGTAFTLVQ